MLLLYNFCLSVQCWTADVLKQLYVLSKFFSIWYVHYSSVSSPSSITKLYGNSLSRGIKL